VFKFNRRRGGIPVKGARQDEVIICRQLAQAGLKLALVDEATGFVDYD
jgi:hypothetical protein